MNIWPHAACAWWSYATVPSTETIEYVAKQVLPNRKSAIAFPSFITRKVMTTGSPGRYVSLSAATEATSRAARVSWLETGVGANTRTATGNVRVAAIATARTTQYGPIRRTAAPNYVTDDETDGVKFSLRTLKGSR